MVKEEMAELKIKVPTRWLNFINEYYEVTGRKSDEDLKMMVGAQIEMLMLEDDLLPLKERVRLHDKYHLSDISEIPQWVRDDAAGIPCPVEPRDPWESTVEKIMDNPKFKEIYLRHMKRAPVEAFVKAMEALSLEEVEEVKAALATAPVSKEVAHV